MKRRSGLISHKTAFPPRYSPLFTPSPDIVAFDVPRTLKVGTLDTLMALNDEVSRADAYAEGVVKKVERQVAESWIAHQTTELIKAGKEVNVNSIGPLKMYVPSMDRREPVPVHDWAASFRWDANTWGEGAEPLTEILKRLGAAAEKIDVDVRIFAQAYQERKTAYMAAERKRR